MRKFFGLIGLVFLISCSSDDDRQRNPNLLDINFQFTLDLSLPQYSQLNFASNPVYVNGLNYGNGGIIITNTGSGSFVAYDAADPNHPPSACSALSIDGIEGVCGCDDGNVYNLFTGLPVTKGLEYPLLVYRVVDNGDGTITVSN